MESPRKKLKTSSEEVSKVTSTPRRIGNNYRNDSPSISHIRVGEESSSKGSSDQESVVSQGRLVVHPPKKLHSSSAEDAPKLTSTPCKTGKNRPDSPFISNIRLGNESSSRSSSDQGSMFSQRRLVQPPKKLQSSSEDASKLTSTPCKKTGKIRPDSPFISNICVGNESLSRSSSDQGSMFSQRCLVQPPKKLLSSSEDASKLTSTPCKTGNDRNNDSLSISHIHAGDESSSRSSISAQGSMSVRRSLTYSGEILPIVNEDINQSSSEDALNNNDSEANESVAEDGDVFDYDEFFSKLTKFQKKGPVWNLYKPIEKEEVQLYYLFLNEPREADEKAAWFVGFCSKHNNNLAIYLLYKLCLDCAGYQKTNIKRFFTDPLPPCSELVRAIIKKVENPKCKGEVWTTGKFLFAENSRLAQIFQNAIYNFVQKFVLRAHDKELLYGDIFTYLLKLLQAMCNASYRQLIYTGTILMMKLLTGICMVRAQNQSDLNNMKELKLDNYINEIYINFSRVCSTNDKRCAPLKLSCISELKIWIHYSPQIFIDHFSCASVLGRILFDEVKTVRLAVLEAFQKIVQDDHLIRYLQKGPIEQIAKHVTERFRDIDNNVAIKAFQLYSEIIIQFNLIKPKKEICETLVEYIYHNDYRIASAACGCLVHLLNANGKTLLVRLCKIGTRNHPTLKPLFVEACMENTNVLQNWRLMIELLIQDIEVEFKQIISELFFESVHQVLTGLTSKVRPYSRRVKEVDLTNHKLIADEIYPHLKTCLWLFKDQPVVAENVLKIIPLIKPEYLTNNHIKDAEEFLPYIMKVFVLSPHAEALSVFLDILVYVNKHLPRLSEASRNIIEDLRKYVSQELYKSFKSRDSQTLVIAKKTSIAFSKFDLNDNIQWNQLVVSWDVIESNSEYLDSMMECCHWSLIWQIRKLYSPHLSEAEKKHKIASLTSYSKDFFSGCLERMHHTDPKIKFKAFERLCETYIAFHEELDNISKQIRTLATLKPSVQEEALYTQITDVFEFGVGEHEGAIVKKYAMYIIDMAFYDIIPMKCISIVLMYYDKQYDALGRLIESILPGILNNNESWIPLILVNTICIWYERFLKKHGAIDVRSRDSKDMLRLSRRFSECKTLNGSKIAGQLLFYAINYAVDYTSYEFLIFVRAFIDNILDVPEKKKEVLDHLNKKVPRSDSKLDPVLYFKEHLTGLGPKKKGVSQKQVNKGRPMQIPQTPKLNMQVKKVKKPVRGKENVVLRLPSQSTESDVTDDMTIHDSSSDDLSVSMSNANVSD